MYEAILAEKLDEVRQEIERLTDAVARVGERKNSIIYQMLDEQLQKYIVMYHKLCAYVPADSGGT